MKTKIKQIIARELNLPEELILNRSRIPHIIEARQMYFYLLNLKLEMKPNDVADFCGYKRLNVRHGIIQVNNHISVEKDYREKINRIIHLIDMARLNPNPKVRVSLHSVRIMQKNTVIRRKTNIAA